MDITIQTIDGYKHIFKNVDKNWVTDNFFHLKYGETQFSVSLTQIMWVEIQKDKHE